MTRTREEVVSLIAAVTAPQRLLRFHLSMPARARMAELIAQAERGELGAEEASELEVYLDLEQILADIRTHARERLLALGSEVG